MNKNELIFCIGYNKSGTTSLYQAIKDLGYKGYPGERMAEAEYLLKDLILEKLWYSKHSLSFKPTLNWIEECLEDNQNVFKDVPFSLPGVWREVYKKYPNAKYILSQRDNTPQWYRSITRFHKIGFGYGDPQGVSWKDLSNVNYRYPSYVHDCMTYINTYGFMKSRSLNPYNQEALSESYDTHNREVKSFFRGKKNFLAVNVANPKDYVKLCSFLDKRVISSHVEFPRLKITNDPSTF